MAHLHDVLDDDPHFKIDADSREIIRTSEKELLLIQDDHNSERCTFDIPKFIDGHDIELCNVIRVHFINVNVENPTETSLGLYEVDDLHVSPNDPSTMVFSWLISSEGTALIGTLSFLVELICKNDEDIIEYSWHTGIYTGGIVSKGMNNSEIVIGQHYDVLNRWVALIDQEGDRVRTDALTRINNAANEARNASVSAINSHAENVKLDLALYGVAVNELLVQEAGNNPHRFMSQASVTELINKLDNEINDQVTHVCSEFNAVKTELSEFMTDISLYNELPLTVVNGKNTASIEISKKYAVESNKTDTAWGFDLKFKSLKCHNKYNEVLEHVESAGISLESTVDRYATGLITVQLLRVEIYEAVAEGVDVYAKHVYEINGERFNQDIYIGSASDTSDKYTIDSSEYIIEGCTKLYEVKDVAEQSAFKVEANGITSITKTATNVTSTGVVNTYTILLDNGTTTTFDVKDGVGISSFSRYSQSDYEDTYKVEFTNGTSMTFTVPNNNTVGIRRSDSAPMIHAEDLIPLDHVIRAKARSKNMIPYPWGDGAGIETSGKVEKDGVTYTIDEDKTIILNGTAAHNTSFNVLYQHQQKVSVTKGKTYTFSCVSGLSGSRGYMFLQIYVGGESKKTYTIRNSEVVTFTSEYDGYVSIGIVLLSGVTFDNDRVQIQLEEGDTVTPYNPYVDLTTVNLTRCCKNLLPPPIIEAGKTKSGVTLTNNGDGTITVNGTATNDLAFVLYQGSMRLKGTYTLSGMTGGSGETYYIQPTFSVGTARGLVDGSRVYEDIDCVMTEIKLNIVAGTSLDNLKISLMFEVGDTASEFEQYHATTHRITSNGDPIPTVESDASPIINLLTDKEGVIIDATYNVDQTAAFNKMEPSSGSAKLYKHRVYLNSIYNEATWAEDPSFSFYINFYRSTATPVTSFDEIQDHELMLEKMKWFTLYEGPDANRTAIALSKSKNGWLVVECISAMYEYETVVFDTTDVSFAPDQFTITDTVYEV